MCPEMILGSRGYNPKAMDAWGLGVILYVMVVGHMPFEVSAAAAKEHIVVTL